MPSVNQVPPVCLYHWRASGLYIPGNSKGTIMSYISPELQRSRRAAARYAALSAIDEGKARAKSRVVRNRVPLSARIHALLVKPVYLITTGQRRRRAAAKTLGTI